MAGLKTLVLVLGVATVSACSPYVYNQEITGFSNGIKSVASSYQTGQQAVGTIVAQRRQAEAAAAGARLMLLPGCDQSDASGTPPKLPDCAVVAFGATTAPPPTNVQTHLADAAPAFDALKTYAASLTAVTTAADETALKQATQSLDAAAGGLAKAVAKVAPSAASGSSLVAPASGLIGEGIVLYLDQRRYAALRGTVPTVDPAVQVLGRTVEAALLDIRAQQLAQLQHDLHGEAEPFEATSVGRLSQGDYQSRLAVLEAKVAAFKQARAGDPVATVTAMVKAHHQLAQALQDNTGQGMAVLTSVTEFANAAAKLESAIEAAADATQSAGRRQEVETVAGGRSRATP
jgi:hypothetical protein